MRIYTNNNVYENLFSNITHPYTYNISYILYIHAHVLHYYNTCIRVYYAICPYVEASINKGSIFAGNIILTSLIVN